VFRQFWSVLCLLLLVSSANLSAQRKILFGVVMDTAGKPLEAAGVSAIRARVHASSDASGRFTIAGLAKGREVFQVRRIGYQAQVFELELGQDDTIRIGVTLARDSAQQLPELGVVVPRSASPAERLEQEAIERILASGAPASSLIPRTELAKSNSGRLYPLLLKHGLKSRIDRRGRDRLVCPRGAGSPTIYLDGLRMASDFDFESFTPDQVEIIEVYRSRSARPAQYNTTGSACTVLIWTRK